MAEIIYISSDENEEIASHNTSLPTVNNNHIASKLVATNNHHIESRTVVTNSVSHSRPIEDCKPPINVNTSMPVSSKPINNSGHETLQKFLQLCKPHIDSLQNLSMDQLQKFALKSFKNSSPTFRDSNIFIENLLLRIRQLENGEKHACLYLEEICSMLKSHKRKADEQDPEEVSFKKIKTSKANSASATPGRKLERKKKRSTTTNTGATSSSIASPAATITSNLTARVTQGNENDNDNKSNSQVIILDSDTSPQSSNPNSNQETGNQRTTNKESDIPSCSNNNSTNSVYVISDATPPQTSPRKRRRIQTEQIDISLDDLELSSSHITGSSKDDVHMSGTDVVNNKSAQHPWSPETTASEKLLGSPSCSITKVENCESPVIILDPTPSCSQSSKQGSSSTGGKKIKLMNGNASGTLQHAPSTSSSQEPLKSETQEPQANGNLQESSLSSLDLSAIREKIEKCEKYLKILHAEIKRLQELELDMDDLMLSDSSYIQECRLKAKVVEVYKRLCDLQNISVKSNLGTHRNIQVSSSRFPEINRKVQCYVNKTKKFPDFATIKYLVKQANKQHNINLSRLEIHHISVDMFQSVGKILKSQRIKDYTLFSGSHLTDAVSYDDDPAEKSAELKKKLEDNRRKGQAAMQAEYDKYVELQQNQVKPSSASCSQQQPGTSTASNNNNDLNHSPQDSDSDAEDPLNDDAESSEENDDDSDDSE